MPPPARLASLVTSYGDAQHRIAVARVGVERQVRRTEAALRRAQAAKAAADRAVRTDNALLTGARANLRKLIAEAAAEREEQEEREEEELAARPPVAHPHVVIPVEQVTRVAVAPTPIEPPAPAPTPTPTPTSTGYVNPLRGVAALSTSRIDQGVDYCGAGPIYAIGDGVVLGTYNGGWPAGTYITYRLTSGPAAGLVVYDAEDINPAVSPGEAVTSATVLGTLYEGPTCMETGWADGGAGDTMAMAAQQFFGSNSTAFGANFSTLLQSLGAPGGELQGSAAGTLPAGWPEW